MSHIYQARTWIDTDGVWTIEVPELSTPGPTGEPIPATGAATSWRKVQGSANELVAAWTDQETETVSVHVTVAVPEEAKALWESSNIAEEQARDGLAESGRVRRLTALKARQAGYPAEATAAAFGVSQQRITQLSSTKRPTTAT